MRDDTGYGTPEASFLALMREASRLQDHTGSLIEFRVALDRHTAALTSEVRALRADKARLDAIESGEVEIECMGTTVPYQWAHGPGGDHVAIRLDRNPKTLREAIDAARLASPSPTGAPAEQQKHEG